MHSKPSRPTRHVFTPCTAVLIGLSVAQSSALAESAKPNEQRKTAEVRKPSEAGKESVVPAEPAAAAQHVQAATALAKGDLTTPLFLCRADSGSVVRQNLESGSKKWLEPSQIFDNLY